MDTHDRQDTPIGICYIVLVKINTSSDLVRQKCPKLGISVVLPLPVVMLQFTESDCYENESPPRNDIRDHSNNFSDLFTGAISDLFYFQKVLLLRILCVHLLNLCQNKVW